MEIGKNDGILALRLFTTIPVFLPMSPTMWPAHNIIADEIGKTMEF
jgi:hypothetical protein